MPSHTAGLPIMCLSLLVFAIGCSGGSTNPEPSSSDTKSGCSAQQGSNSQQANGPVGQQQPAAPAGNQQFQNQNQATASAQTGGSGVYTLQGNGTYKVWGTDLTPGDTAGLTQLLLEHREDIQATDQEYTQALALLVEWAKGSSKNNPGAAAPTGDTAPANASSGGGFTPNANAGNSNPCN